MRGGGEWGGVVCGMCGWEYISECLSEIEDVDTDIYMTLSTFLKSSAGYDCHPMCRRKKCM